jgi:Fe2+ or Zn2+ uptake regulation protein
VIKVEDRLNKIKELLKDKGYRMTRARKEIIKIFLSEDSHLSGEEIYNRVKSKHVSMATVYRTINILEKNGIIKKTIFNNTKYYELKLYSKKCTHIHFKCEKCGKIFDIDNQNIILKVIDIIDKIEKQKNFIIKDISAIFSGICEECKRR